VTSDGTGELRYTSAPQRRGEILRRIRTAGYVSPPELSTELSVSERTIRRDLQKLAELGQAELVYGGALAVGGLTSGPSFETRVRVRSEQKRAIARAALRLIEPGATIGIDTGTTTLELTHLLPAGTDVTVVTHSLPAMETLGKRSDVTLVGLGGLYRPPAQAFTGPDTVAAIGRLRVHTFFLAASGLSDRGPYCATPLDAETKRTFIDIAERVVLLADSSKPNRTAPVPICDYTRVDTLITDDGLTQADRSWLAAATNLLVAPT
jgi:DeoR/GlpR family transcriptional regulator of sugar metabolism